MMAEPGFDPWKSLTPEAFELVEAYFARVHGTLLVSAVDEYAEVIEDLRAYVMERLADTPGEAADVKRVLAELGPPETLAAQCADASMERDDEAGRPASTRWPLSGKVLGVPYELRLPTADRVASRWWDPRDPRILMPRLFGLGWTFNFGAIAVRLGLVRPDDEDVPFGSVPERHLALALAMPVAIALAFGVLVAVSQASLPAKVAVHYGFSGVPDGFAGKDEALALPAAMVLIGLLLALLPWLRKRPPLARVASGAFGTMLGTISLGAYAQGVATAHGETGTTVLLAALACSLVLPFALLVSLSRVGRAAEVRRDLGKSTKGEA